MAALSGLGSGPLASLIAPSRRVRIGKKRMPVTGKDRFWARVERVGSLQRVLGDVLEPEAYTTKTRGERFQPGARPIAVGSYAFEQHDDHVHFAYQVAPFAFEDAPDDIAVPESGRHLVLWKNAGRSRAIWTQQGSVDQLDRERAQIVLVGSSRCEADGYNQRRDDEPVGESEQGRAAPQLARGDEPEPARRGRRVPRPRRVRPDAALAR